MQSDRQVKTGRFFIKLSVNSQCASNHDATHQRYNLSSFFKHQLRRQFTFVVCILLFLIIPSEADFQKEKRNNRIGFQIKSWKRQFETGLKTNKMMKADKNFCLSNAVRLKSEKYFFFKCATDEEKNTFFGFTDGKLGRRKLYNINDQ